MTALSIDLLRKRPDWAQASTLSPTRVMQHPYGFYVVPTDLVVDDVAIRVPVPVPTAMPAPSLRVPPASGK